jgi:hypothetical protein
MDFISQNWLELLVGLMAFLKVVTNLTPTENSNRKRQQNIWMVRFSYRCCYS